MFNEINPGNEMECGLFQDQGIESNEYKDEGSNNIQNSKSNKKGRPKGQKNHKNNTQKRKKGSQKLQNKKIGHWNAEENKKYHWFLQIYSNHFLQKHLRRSDKIFKTMEIFLGTRQAEQCRSHHQKMQKKYKSFEKILLNLRNQNFGTDDSAPVIDELAKNNLEFPDGIVDSSILYAKKEQQQGKNESIQEENPFENKELDYLYEDRKNNNIMSDEYQNEMSMKFFF